MPRFPFPFPRRPSPYPRQRRRYPRRVGLVGAIALLIAAVAGGISHCSPPPARDAQQTTASQSPAPSVRQQAPATAPAPAAPPARYDTLDGQPVTAQDEVRGIWDTLRRIARGPPFPYKQDGASFSNREGRLPKRERGWWHEYTVETPGSPDRGARRLVVGKDGEVWYTADHYRSFVRLVLP